MLHISNTLAVRLRFPNKEMLQYFCIWYCVVNAEQREQQTQKSRSFLLAICSIFQESPGLQGEFSQFHEMRANLPSSGVSASKVKSLPHKKLNEE